MATLTTLNAASPLNASDNVYLSFTADVGPESLTRALDNTNADFGTMDTLTWAVEYSVTVVPGDDVYGLSIRIINGATILAAADVGGTAQVVSSNVTSTTDTTSAATAFAYINTGASKATWDGASVELTQNYTKTKGGDGSNIRVDQVTFNGTYTIGIAAQPITGAAFTNTSTFGAGSTTATYNITGVNYTNTSTFGAGTVVADQTLTGVNYTNTNTFGTGSFVSANGLDALFLAGEGGVFYDPSVPNTLFTDSAGTIPAVADDPIGRMLDLSGNNNHAIQTVDLDRPIYRTAGGLHWLEFDGVNSCMITTNNVGFASSDEVTTHVGVRKTSDATTAVLIELSNITDNQVGTFAIFAPSLSGTNKYRWTSRGSTIAAINVTDTAFNAPTTNVLTTQGKISTDLCTIRLDGVDSGSNASDQGTGTFDSGWQLRIAARQQDTLKFTGDIYTLVVRNKLPTGTELADAEAELDFRVGGAQTLTGVTYTNTSTFGTGAITQPVAAVVSAFTGASKTTDGLYDVYTFSADGTITFSGAGEVEYLIVGGGGGGGSNRGGGGGGAGGFLSGTTSVAATLLNAVVGAGGAPSTTVNGGNSSFNSVVSNGGGAGAWGDDVPTTGGGSGGGGAGNTTIARPGGVGTIGQGFDGGVGNNSAVSFGRAGGGGGAGAAGTDSPATRNGVGVTGGIGALSSITGTSVRYAGGGGGGANDGGVPGTVLGGAGGLGGGGAGSDNRTDNAVAGTAGTGGGGGGSQADNAGPGADGGSGVVILRVLAPTGGQTVTGVSYTNTNTFGTGSFATIIDPPLAFLFQAGEVGGVFDPSVENSIFQTSLAFLLGVPEVSSGLVLDQSQFSTALPTLYGPELIVNGSFDTDTDWTKGSGVTISGGVANCTDAATIVTEAVSSLTIGVRYRAKVDYNKTSGLALRFETGAGQFASATLANGVGSFFISFVATATTLALGASGAVYSGTIDNISVREELEDLESSLAPILGADVVTNGTFDADTDWTKGGGVTISGGVANCTSSATIVTQTGLTVDRRYFAKVDYNKTSGSGLRFQTGANQFASAALANGAGSFFVSFVATSTTFSVAANGAVYSGTIDNVVIKEIPGNHAVQATASFRPNYKTDDTLFWLGSDEVDDSLIATLPNLGTNATVWYSTEAGSTILTAQTVSGSFEILRGANTYAVGAVDRALTAGETTDLTTYLDAKRGAVVTGQTVTGASYSDPDTFGSGTVVPGAVSITGSAVASITSFGVGTLTALYTLTGASYSDPDTFGAGSVATSYSIAGTNYTNTNTVGAGTLSTSYTIDGVAYSDADTFGNGSFDTPGPLQTLTGVVYADADVFGTGSLSTSYSMAGASYIDPDSFGSSSLTTSYTINGVSYSDADTFGTGAIDAGASPQTLTGVTYSDPDSFGVGSLTSSYNIDGVAYSDADSYGVGTLTVLYSIVGVTYSDADTFGTGSVSTGPVSITGTSYIDPDTFGSGNIAVSGAPQAITGVTYSDADVFGTGSITGSYTLTGAAYTNTSSIGNGSFALTYNVSGALYNDADTFGSGNIATADAPQAITGVTYSDADTFGSGTVTTGAVTITGVSYSDVDTFGSGNVGATAPPQALTGVIYVDADTFGTGTVSSSYTLTGVSYTNENTVSSGVISGAITLNGVTYENLTVFHTGILFLQGSSRRRSAYVDETLNDEQIISDGVRSNIVADTIENSLVSDGMTYSLVYDEITETLI